MIKRLTTAFKELLNDVPWMDSDTRKAANEKVSYFCSIFPLIRWTIFSFLFSHTFSFPHLWTKQKKINARYDFIFFLLLVRISRPNNRASVQFYPH